jgi:hypothetical protein
MVRLAKILGLLASAAAVIGLLLTCWQVNHDLTEKRLQGWEEVVVYSICMKAGYKGATLDQIKQGYSDAAKDLPVELPREAQQTDSVKRTLISLQSKQAIVYLPGDSYAPAISQPVPEGAMIEALGIKVRSFVIPLVRQQPHTYTEEQLRSKVMQAFPEITSGQLEDFFGSLTLNPNHPIGFDDDHKAVLNNSADKR